MSTMNHSDDSMKEPFDVINIDSNNLHSDLVTLLKENNLYHDLYQTLNDYNFTMNILNQLKTKEFDKLCTDLNLTMIQKLKFRTLIDLIHKSNMDETDVDVDLKEFLFENELSDLYHILRREGITFENLETITPHDIDRLCDDNNIKIGTKINLKNVIDQHQIDILTNKYSTPGNPLYAEREQKKDEGKYDEQMKVILLGDSAVGKTCLFKRYVFHKFDIDSYMTTMGVDYGVARQLLSGGIVMKMNIWDTAGQERFRSISRAYYRDADAIILCYGVDNRLSFDNLSEWRDDIAIYAQRKDIVIMLVGCKGDINMKIGGKGNARQVSLHDVRDLARSYAFKQFGVQWGECSSKTGDNVESIFTTVAELVMQQRMERLKKDDEIKCDGDLKKSLLQLESSTSGDQSASSGCCF